VLKIPHNPWDDMDSGESTEPSTYAAVDFLNGSALAVAIVLIGFEVDSEAAAKEQIDNWGDAFGLYVTEAWKVLASGGAVAEAVDIVKLIGLTWSLIAAAAAVVLVAVIGFIWAAWAPADLIAADLLVWTSGQLFSLTDTKTPLAKEYSGESISGIDVTVRPQNKVPPFNGASFARYNGERRYRSEDEDSLYGLNIHVERVPEA
jgi:hypothetical protein